MTWFGKILTFVVLIGSCVWAYFTVNAYVTRTNWKVRADNFEKAYKESEGETIQAAFEADVVAIVLTSFIQSLATRSWEGTPTTLFAAINDHATETQRKSKWWPPSPAALTNRIERAAPVLRSQGVHVERRRTRADRLITIVALDPA